MLFLPIQASILIIFSNSTPEVQWITDLQYSKGDLFQAQELTVAVQVGNAIFFFCILLHMIFQK
jgi:hypothetical protein